MIGNIFSQLRLSLGDFDFEITNNQLTKNQRFLYWGSFTIMYILASLIFLNFIIAEVGNTYETVKEQIDALIFKERAKLIREAEIVMLENTKRNDTKKFPKYIVVRECEE